MAKKPRSAKSYRAARRNACLRSEPKGVWDSDWYATHHPASRGRRYSPANVRRAKA